MTGQRWRRATLVVTAGAVALTAWTGPAQAAGAPGWRLSAAITVRGEDTVLTTVAAVSARDAWAMGFADTPHVSAVIRHWNGRAWAAVRLPARIAAAWSRQLPVFVTAAASRGAVLMFSTASEGYYLFGTGRHWRLGKLPGINSTVGYDITSAAVFSATDAWAFGVKSADTSAGWRYGAYAAHFNGRRWAAVPVSARPAVNSPTVAFPAVSAISPHNIWAIAGRSVLRWTGGARFYKAAVQPGLARGAVLTSIVAEPGGTVWVTGVQRGTAFAADWNGSGWTLSYLPASRRFDVFSLTSAGRAGLWALAAKGSGSHAVTGLWHYARGAWTGPLALHFGRAPQLFGVAAVPHTDSAWAVGAVRKGSAYAGIIAVSGPTPR